jgi:hypothetical protein
MVRAEAWDREQQRVADAARLEEIERANRKAVQAGDLMMDAVIARIPKAAASLNRSPHALAAWAEVAAKLHRQGLDQEGRIHHSRRSECAHPARNAGRPGALDAGRGATGA